MEFLAVLLVFGLVAAAQYMWGGGRGRKRRQRPVPRPGTSGYHRDSDAHMLFYAASDPNSMINGQMPDGSRCDDPPAGGDAGWDQGDCAPDNSDTDSYDSGESDSGDSDSGGWDSGGSDSGGWDSGGGDSGGGDSGGGDSGGSDSSN